MSERLEGVRQPPGAWRPYRLRDLLPRERVVAVLLVLGLLLAPVIAFFHWVPVWRPAGDPAYMALRALDVGTNRTPLIGQPSSSGFYTEQYHVHHLGASHFYLMAPLVRLFGAATGMLAVSVLTTAGASLVSVWAVFRRFGPATAVMSVAVMGAVLFGIGAAGMLNPVSSSFAGLPLFGAALLAWAVLAGDDRLLPLAAVALTFTVHQHLSVGPTVAVLGLTLVLGAGGNWWKAGLRHDGVVRRRAVRLSGMAVGLSLLLWLPLLLQEAVGTRGNLSALATYTGDGGEEGRQGLGVALNQVVHVLGYPPLVIRTQLSGLDLLEPPTAAEWLSAGLVTAVLVTAGVRWWRAGDPRWSLVAMVGVMAAAGLANGSSIPLGPEVARLAFYHWMWPMAFFGLLALLLLASDGFRAARDRIWPSLRPEVTRTAGSGASVVVVIALVVAAAANPLLDRPTNDGTHMIMTYPREVYEDLARQVAAAQGRIPDGDALLISQGEVLFEGSQTALALSLEEQGVPVLYSDRHTTYVHGERIAAERGAFSSILLLVVHRLDDRHQPPGELIAEAQIQDIDLAAYEDLVATFTEAEVVPGREMQRLLEDSGRPSHRRAERVVSGLETNPREVLQNPRYLDLLLDHPVAEPDHDRNLLVALRDQADKEIRTSAVRMEVYLLTEEDDIRTAAWWFYDR